jgi:hypothetical protein
MRGRIPQLVSLAAALAALTTGIAFPITPAAEKINFSRDVLPILSDKCFKCHGPDSGTRMAGLRLDTSEGAYASRNGKYAIVPGKPEHSMLVARINHPDTPMPPPDSGKSLTAEQKKILTQWIAEGAKYNRLWSLEPLPKKVPVPKVAGNWAKDDLDRFILDRLNREGLKPSPPADRARWLRRVTLDLNGQPPTEAEIQAFVGNKDPQAEEKVVDRLLASPHYGERVATDWLDAARYSDSYGYQSDLIMPTWPYRDWVVKAFNANMPYDEFLTEQIAGDLLPNPTRDQRLATAFNRLHRQSNEGGSIALEFKTEYAVDRVDTFGTAVLGLTVGCARCHDHKFDPITQKEYYQLFGYFNSIDEYGLLLSTEIVPTPSLLLPTPEQESKLAELHRTDDAAYAKYQETRRTMPSGAGGQGPIPNLVGRWSLDSLVNGQYINDIDASKPGLPIGAIQQSDGKKSNALSFSGDDGILFKGLPARDRWEPFTWSFWVKDPRQAGPVVLLHRTGGTDVGFCGFDLMLEDGYLTARVMRHWPGNAVAIRTKHQLAKDEWVNVTWSWDGSGRAEGLKLYTNGHPIGAEVVANRLWKRIYAYGDLGPSGGEWSFGQRFRDAGFKGGMIDEVLFADRALEEIEIQRLYGALPGASDQTALSADALTAAAEMRAAQAALAQFEEGIQEISVMEDAKEEVPAYLLARGQYDAPRTEENRVHRNVPASLPALGKPDPNNRLTLARWATQPDHPLTSRVAVNRLWQLVFGTGLVETSENFGTQGSQPSHPELLDYLARRFVDSGWDVKAMLKAFVLSATYRQDSMRRKDLDAKDPENRLYGRGPSRRLSAEMIRDTVLSASGLLTDRLGGPPVNPYQPAGIWQENNTMSPGFVQSKGEDLYRRSLYSTVKRTTPVPSMLTFDATSREACTIRRPSTNTPMQALVLLNDIQFVEAARVLAERVIKESSSTDARLRRGFLLLSGRDPDPQELAILAQTYAEQLAQFTAAPEEAAKLIKVGEKPPASTATPPELAAMTVTMQLILNSDAVVWKR